jgi:hypothetical protein
MEFYEFLKYLHYGTVGNYIPFYWAIKGKNIIITKGKTGTNTLKYYSDTTSENGYINLYNILENIYKENFKIHILIREPNSRFKSGIFQEVSMCIQNHNLSNYSKELNKINFSKIDNWNDEEWVSNLENFIIDFINNIIENKTEKYTYHVGNWLHYIKYLKMMFPKNSIKIWQYTDFNKLLFYLDCDIKENTVFNSSEEKPFINEYLNAYNKLSDDVKNKISMYLHDDVEIWNELINEDKKYISIFDREIPPSITNVVNEIPNEKTDKA